MPALRRPSENRGSPGRGWRQRDPYENESVTVGTGKDGGVTISIDHKPEPEAENGVEVEVGPQRPTRAAPPARREKMAVSANPSGSLEITPEMGQQLVVLGDA